MKFVVSVFFLLLPTLTFGMPAYPRMLYVDVAGKMVPIYLYGDETHKRAETIDGYTICQNEKNVWCYVKKGNGGDLELTEWTIADDRKKLPELVRFLQNTQKHIEVPRSMADSSKLARNKRVPTHQVVGTRHFLVILMSFKDVPFSKSKEDFDALFNQQGYSEDGAIGSVSDFYHDVSYGQLKLTSDIYGPYTAQNDMRYYGGNGKFGGDKAPEELFKEAIKHVSKEVDFTMYDADKDGIVDNVHIIFAGYGEEAGANQNAIWSHEMTFRNSFEYNGVKFDRYSCAPELRENSGKGISRIGPHCHEIGHALGAMDYYDTDYSTNGEFEGTGQWDVMAAGSWNNDGIAPADFNPHVKAYDYGWIMPQPLPDGETIIPSSLTHPDGYYFIKSPNSSEYYILENRTRDKWGEGVPAEGLLIYHVHKDINKSGNEINARAPQKCYLVCASSSSSKPGNSPSSYGKINSTGCPYPGISGNHSFGANTTPMAFYWGADDCNIELDDINIDNNGCIRLVNNSRKIIEPESEDYRPVFFEDFEEDMKIFIIEDSTTIWRQVENSYDITTSKEIINAYEGKKSLQLSAKNSATVVNSAFTFSCQNLSDKGKVRIKFHATAQYSQKNWSPSRILVEYKKGENKEWQSQYFSLSENSVWMEFMAELPNGVLSDFKMTGTATPHSILAIDNIEVLQESTSDDTRIASTSQRGVPTIYNYNGMQLQTPTKGLNIFRMPNGSYKKVIIHKKPE